jgi:hypothetical protein
MTRVFPQLDAFYFAMGEGDTLELSGPRTDDGQKLMFMIRVSIVRAPG